MKLQKAIDLGKDIGLSTVEECVDNIFYHALNFFKYNEIETELMELKEEEKQYREGNLEINL